MAFRADHQWQKNLVIMLSWSRATKYQEAGLSKFCKNLVRREFVLYPLCSFVQCTKDRLLYTTCNFSHWTGSQEKKVLVLMCCLTAHDEYCTNAQQHCRAPQIWIAFLLCLAWQRLRHSNTTQHKTKQNNATQYHVTQDKAKQYHATQDKAKQYHSIPHITRQSKTTPQNTTQHVS